MRSLDIIGESVRKLARGEGDPNALLSEATSCAEGMLNDRDFDRRADGARIVSVIGSALKSLSYEGRIAWRLKGELGGYFGSPWWQPDFFDSGRLYYPPDEHYWAILVAALEQVCSVWGTPPELQQIMCGILRHGGERGRVWSGEWLSIHTEPPYDPEYSTRAAEALLADPWTPPAGKAAACYLLARLPGSRQTEAYGELAETVVASESSGWLKARCRRYLLELAPAVESEAIESAFLCLMARSRDPEDQNCGRALLPEVFGEGEDGLEDYSDDMLCLLLDQLTADSRDETDAEREQRLRTTIPNWEWRLDREISARAIWPDTPWHEAAQQLLVWQREGEARA